jgi:AbrB family looped-hinge helix DNA binding protein
MDAIVTIDGAGRVVIPKTLREQLGLSPGDNLALEIDGERVTLKPVRSTPALSKEHGIWVFRSGRKVAAADTDRALERLRHERSREARGSKE